jgi:hypothetical protein
LPTPSTSCSPTSSPSAASWPRESVRRPPATLDGPRLVTTRCARARTGPPRPGGWPCGRCRRREQLGLPVTVVTAKAMRHPNAR